TISLTNTHLLSFSCNRYRRHPDLHSFPTRRSSDLRILLWLLPLAHPINSLLILNEVIAPFSRKLPDHGSPAATGKQLLIPALGRDRKSTRLNSSHVAISYAVFCLKKKKDRAGCSTP